MNLRSYFYLLLALNLVTIIFMFSKISLTGYWTDIIGASIVGAITILSIKKFENFKKSLLLLLAVGHGLLYLRLFILFVLLSSFGEYPLRIPIDTNKESVVIDHEYFMPTGAYGCGYGTVWKTKSFKCIPFFEYEVYRDNCADHNYGSL